MVMCVTHLGWKSTFDEGPDAVLYQRKGAVGAIHRAFISVDSDEVCFCWSTRLLTAHLQSCGRIDLIPLPVFCFT